MTKDERLQWLKQIEKDIYVSSLVSTFTDDMKSCAIHSVIEDLEHEPETGHWILLDECANSGYYCSKCHKKVVKEGWSNTVKRIKYCPNCGAEMEIKMTREEAIKILKAKINTMEDGAICCNYGNDKEVFDMAIKALEQESALDKAREEILNLIDADAYGDYQQGVSVGLSVALQAIDRSKAESEDK